MKMLTAIKVSELIIPSFARTRVVCFIDRLPLVFILPQAQVVLLSGIDQKLMKGDTVYAVYPDTTAFYQATIINIPKKSNNNGDTIVTVQFKDDSDEFGITHEKAVPLKYVMKL
jgi:hypothetical protein